MSLLFEHDTVVGALRRAARMIADAHDVPLEVLDAAVDASSRELAATGATISRVELLEVIVSDAIDGFRAEVTDPAAAEALGLLSRAGLYLAVEDPDASLADINAAYAGVPTTTMTT